MGHEILETLARKQEERTDPGERAFAREVNSLASDTILRLSIAGSSTLTALGAALSATAALVLAADRETACPQDQALEVLRQLLEDYAKRPDAQQAPSASRVQA